MIRLISNIAIKQIPISPILLANHQYELPTKNERFFSTSMMTYKGIYEFNMLTDKMQDKKNKNN